MAATPPFHVVLMQPEIPPNTGNIARLCAATGAALHLVEPLGFDLSDRSLKRAGLDYWPHVNVRTWTSWPALLAALPSPPRCWYFTTKTTRSYTRAAFQRGDYLVFGRETKGLPEPLLAQHPDSCLTIPQVTTAVRSINLATAVAIGLYEALRQIGALEDGGLHGPTPG